MTGSRVFMGESLVAALSPAPLTSSVYGQTAKGEQPEPARGRSDTQSQSKTDFYLFFNQ
jgi:hypothetical protein